MSVIQAAKEIIWLTNLLKQLNIKNTNKLLVIHIDNQRSMCLFKNPEYHARTKHINIQHHFIQATIEMKQVELVYCPTQDMVADVLMKALVKAKHEYFCEQLNIF